MSVKTMPQMMEQYLEYLIQASTPENPVWNREKDDKEIRFNWSYVNALFMTALLRLYKKEGQERYLRFVDTFMDAYITQDGGIRSYQLKDYNIDHICGGCVLMDLYQLTGKEKYVKAVEGLMDQLRSHPRTLEGSFWHKRIYPNQLWLDGLYMAQPFYMRYGAEMGDWNICRDSIRQFKTVRQRMRDSITGLYYHGYDSTKSIFWADDDTGCSKSFWLRSLGWLAMACVDTMEEIPQGMEEEKEWMKSMFQNLMESVIPFQDKESGMWHQVVDQGKKQGNYLETSGSAMLSYALMKGTRLGYLNDTYGTFGKAAFDGICKTQLQEQDGAWKLGGICLVAGLGGMGTRRDGTYSYYISEPIVENDGKGIGPLVLAFTER